MIQGYPSHIYRYETLTPQAQLSLQGTFFSFLIMLNSELCAWGVKGFKPNQVMLKTVTELATDHGNRVNEK